MKPLRVSDNKRHLVRADGTPFFWLGDTAWELCRRCHRGEVDHYLANRASKGFNVVQTVVLSELNGLTEPNRDGHRPLVDLDPTRPNEPYFEHVDYVVRRAAAAGLYVALLPTWGAYVVQEKHPLFESHQIFDAGNARAYGGWIGRRYRDATNLVWVLGGDRDPHGYEPVWDAMAEGLRDGDGGAHPITYHPRGGASSADLLHDRPWLDFNMVQSGHARKGNNNYDLLARTYDRAPTKPVFDGEPNYEDAGLGFDGAGGRLAFDDHDVRNAAYWSVFAGGFGVTYGANTIWQMWQPGMPTLLNPKRSWKEALDLPGAYQLRWLRRLVESRPMLTRIPDQSLVAGHEGFGTDHRQATRDGTPGRRDATYLMVYNAVGASSAVDTGVIAGRRLRVWWYDPRHGTAYPMGECENTGRWSTPWHARPWESGTCGPDWVLVIDDAGKGYPPPGERAV